MRQTWLALKAWLFLFVSELFNPLGFLIAGFVGFTINIVQSGKILASAGNTLQFLKKTQAKTFEELFMVNAPVHDYLVWCDEIKNEG